ncbi:MAG TPA: chorismate synthase [Phycisphaerae bacterium]|nr:chorismate synthase [Phycisphaerae bacterium]HPS52464.1 chorismate synthase [Phycisphaerae bacterium]
MSSSTGTIFRVTTFGESHGAALGAVVDGVPAGLKIDMAFLQQHMNRRRPGTSKFVSPRKEPDKLEILSGVDSQCVTLGTPLTLIVRNTDVHSEDYASLRNTYRPGHADFTYHKKYGVAPQPGGGRSSGRETLARVAAGTIARLILGEQVKIFSYCTAISGVVAKVTDIPFAEMHPLRFADPALAAKAEQAVLAANKEGNSVGGIIELLICGVPAGLGEPVFEKLDAALAGAVMSIGAVKGIEFGAGFRFPEMTGQQANDQMSPDGFESNNAGGIIGGISTGQNIIMRLAVKPTPSIAVPQKSITFDGKAATVTTTGRHDPCVAPRVAIVAEAMAAIVLADALLCQKTRIL